MSAFEFYFSFYGLLMGLCVAQIASGIGHAVVVRRESRLGWLTPGLAAFLMLDVASFWLNAWNLRDSITVGQVAIYSGLFIAVCYYLAAVLLFPVHEDAWENLDGHYWSNKRWVVVGIAVANAATFAWAISSEALANGGVEFYLRLALTYWVPLAILIISRSSRVDTLCLSLLIGTYVYSIVT